MSLLTILKSVALDVGMAEPLTGIGSTVREVQELVRFANIMGLEIAGRVAWGGLTKTAIIAGDGTNNPRSLPADLLFLVDGITMQRPDGGIVRPLTRAEWNMPATEGPPRYFLKEGLGVRLWPYLTNAATVSVPYQSANWCSNGTSAFIADADTTVFPEDALEKGLIFHWRLQKGMPYQDQEAAFDAVMARYASFDDRARL